MADLLKKAIADAKEVKALALANAKLTLEETFQPTLQRMISSKISEEDGEFDEEPIEDEIPDEIPTEEPAVGFGGGEEELPAEGGEEDELEFSEDDLEEEINRIMSEMDGEDFEDDDTVVEGEEDDWQDPNPETDELTEDEINEILGEEEFCDTDEPVEEITEDDGSYDSKVSVKRSNTESLRRQNIQLKKDLNEALRAITTMKTAFNEVNLLNARLMYSQKVFKDFDLNKDQRLKVLEAFDRANSVREVKSKYSDMLALLNGRKQQNRKPALESASKPIKQANPTAAQKQSLNEGFNFVARWQELANIKK